MKRCIFHIPNNIDLTGKSGSQVRPGKMLKALKNQGYEVDFVMGYGKARKESIKSIKKIFVKVLNMTFCILKVVQCQHY